MVTLQNRKCNSHINQFTVMVYHVIDVVGYLPQSHNLEDHNLNLH